MSRTPIRTALERLVEQKLVEQVGEKGFRVCQIDWKDCMALYDIREMIESNACLHRRQYHYRSPTGTIEVLYPCR
ncbi:MAG: hypothetical protein ACLRNW_09015 [Neglectibacter sp.]